MPKPTLAIVALLASTASAAPPKHCNAAVIINAVVKGDVTSKITAMKGPLVTLATGFEFRFVAETPTPFAVGDTIHIAYRCGGPPPGIYCDARIADAHDKTLVIAAMNGTDDYSDGWVGTRGKTLTSKQNPNETRASIEHTPELTLAKRQTSATVGSSTCTEIRESGDTWYASGGARSWEGIRPPEGIDYKWYSLSRAP
jgi:hypothetical protein